LEALRYTTDVHLNEALFKESYVPSFDNTKLHFVEWMPDKFPKAMLLLVHGLGDHILRYRLMAQFFNENQIAVIGMDMRGHGKSGGSRGAGFYINYLKDISTLVDYAKRRFPHLPKVLYGHSLGGTLTLNYIIRNRTNLAGVVSSSPWIRPVSYSDVWSLPVLRYLNYVYPVITMSERFKAELLSHDSNVGQMYESDPLVRRRVSINLLFDAAAAGDYILRNKHKVNVPLLLMHGSGDKITSCAASSEFAKNTSSLTNFRLWLGAFHELHNEVEKDAIFEYILRWMLNLPQVQR
jgi:alpha-beta hydrolase superfamily lysophospholipase